MYHVAVGIASDDEQIPHKVDAVSELPESTDDVRVTLVHVHDGERPVESVPSVTEAKRRFAEADVSVDIHGAIGGDAPREVIEAMETLDADLLCIGGRRRSPAGKLQLKSGAQEILLQTDQPVVVAGRVDE